jgi:hypothetical protein
MGMMQQHLNDLQHLTAAEGWVWGSKNESAAVGQLAVVWVVWVCSNRMGAARRRGGCSSRLGVQQLACTHVLSVSILHHHHHHYLNPSPSNLTTHLPSSLSAA